MLGNITRTKSIEQHPPHPLLGYNSPGSTGNTPVGEYTSHSAFNRISAMQE